MTKDHHTEQYELLESLTVIRSVLEGRDQCYLPYAYDVRVIHQAVTLRPSLVREITNHLPLN